MTVTADEKRRLCHCLDCGNNTIKAMNRCRALEVVPEDIEHCSAKVTREQAVADDIRRYKDYRIRTGNVAPESFIKVCGMMVATVEELEPYDNEEDRTYFKPDRKQLQMVMNEKGITAKRMKQLTGISIVSIRQVLNGRKERCYYHTAKMMADCLGVDPEQFGRIEDY
ncbi:MAG: helix-turn-helix transcriptional regulator [Oscillospiraceae bacterium]|nr:helix-turn-helix transcriptional regulator [Oscillospiraceae bacterium]